MNSKKLKFLINTRHLTTASSKVCVHDLSSLLKEHGFEVKINDWSNYQDYDVVIFLCYDPEIKKARSINPDILVGLADPKLNKNIQDAIDADFLTVSSLEQRDVFLRYNKNIFIYYMFPDIKKVEKNHQQKDKTIIGYHGNKLHLEALCPKIQSALNELGKKYDIEFWAMYNIKNLGKWNFGLPDEKYIKVRHIQWSEENYYDYLSKVDIGIVPNILPVSKEIKTKGKHGRKLFAYNSNDYLVRYKYSSNPGRIYVFSQLGIPVVSDFFPSASQFIFDGQTGFLANSAEGWYHALEKLILQPRLREDLAANLQQTISQKADRVKTFEAFLDFVNEIYEKMPLENKKIIIEEKNVNFFFEDARKTIQDILNLVKQIWFKHT
jgi:glycosyltransferase involved in cell wall biosynthesis